MVEYMSGPQFEVFVADVMRGLGYRATVLGGSGDQGVDIIATSDNGRIAIQCKRYLKPIGNKPIQEVYAGARHHSCTTAWVVASAGFTRGAVELARSVNVSLHDSHALQAWIRQIDKRDRISQNSEVCTADLDERKDLMGSNAEKQNVRVGLLDGNVGETVAFTAENLGTAAVNGGMDGGGLDYTFYRLPDGHFRVLVEGEGTAILVPSNMEEAISRGERNNYSYGRMTLEEMKVHEYDFGTVYEKLMENHPDTVRDID